jgi:hypothetical protein
MNWQWNRDAAKNHILGVMNSNATDDKKKSRHHALARNEGWLPPLPTTGVEESSEDDDNWI